MKHTILFFASILILSSLILTTPALAANTLDYWLPASCSIDSDCAPNGCTEDYDFVYGTGKCCAPFGSNASWDTCKDSEIALGITIPTGWCGYSHQAAATDNDNDGYVSVGGSDPSGGTSCSVPFNETDCNDNDANTYPGAGEICDGDVNDCLATGVTANQTETSVCLVEYYCSLADTDGDSYIGASITGTCNTFNCSAQYGNDCVNVAPNDCDDSDNTVYPGATELCDGVDNDCNAVVDDGLTAPLAAMQAGVCVGSEQVCAGSAGWIEPDYTTITSYESTEVSCDTLDNDCDGSVDENVQNTYYIDLDGDGYGSASTTTLACVEPSNYVSNNLDCNDNENTIYPGATESCNDKDDDCDGSTDEDLWQAASNQAGLCAGNVEYCSAGNWIANASNYVPSTDMCDGLDNNCDGSTDESFVTLGTSCNVGIGACSATGVYVCNSDANATICDAVAGTPTAETCDGIDNDCNALIDDGLTAPLAAMQAGVCVGSEQVCSGSSGWIEPDYTLISSYEVSELSCDGLDNDCDSSVDEELKTTFYNDSDVDLYGDANDFVLACIAPTNFVLDNTDNCPLITNPDQTDTDADGIGDACDAHSYIEGIVFFDNNSNGVFDSNESALSAQFVLNGENVSVPLYSENTSVQTLTYVLDGYYATTPTSVNFVNTLGSNTTIYFGVQNETSTSAIYGTVFNDSNMNGEQDDTEIGLANVNVSIGNLSMFTSTYGQYTFGVDAGTYTVQEEDLSNYVSTTANTVNVNVLAGNSYEVNFGDVVNTTGYNIFYGYVFNNLNKDGVFDGNETGLGGVNISLNNESVLTTDGYYIFVTNATNVTLVQTDLFDYTSTTPNSVSYENATGSYQTNFGDVAICHENWVCTDWSNTAKSCGERTCTDLNSCGTVVEKPTESLSCPSGGGGGGGGGGTVIIVVNETNTTTPSNSNTFVNTSDDTGSANNDGNSNFVAAALPVNETEEMNETTPEAGNQITGAAVGAGEQNSIWKWIIWPFIVLALLLAGYANYRYSGGHPWHKKHVRAGRLTAWGHQARRAGKLSTAHRRFSRAEKLKRK